MVYWSDGKLQSQQGAHPYENELSFESFSIPFLFSTSDDKNKLGQSPSQKDTKNEPKEKKLTFSNTSIRTTPFQISYDISNGKVKLLVGIRHKYDHWNKTLNVHVIKNKKIVKKFRKKFSSRKKQTKHMEFELSHDIVKSHFFIEAFFFEKPNHYNIMRKSFRPLQFKKVDTPFSIDADLNDWHGKCALIKPDLLIHIDIDEVFPDRAIYRPYLSHFKGKKAAPTPKKATIKKNKLPKGEALPSTGNTHNEQLSKEEKEQQEQEAEFQLLNPGYQKNHNFTIKKSEFQPKFNVAYDKNYCYFSCNILDKNLKVDIEAKNPSDYVASDCIALMFDVYLKDDYDKTEYSDDDAVIFIYPSTDPDTLKTHFKALRPTRGKPPNIDDQFENSIFKHKITGNGYIIECAIAWLDLDHDFKASETKLIGFNFEVHDLDTTTLKYWSYNTLIREKAVNSYPKLFTIATLE